MQSTAHILMIRPAAPGFNSETSATNAFQRDSKGLRADETLRRVLQEFDDFVDILRKKGVKVNVFHDDPAPKKPDAIFPNNWISFHPDGRVFLFPMLAPSRRLERNPKVLELIGEKYRQSELIDFSAWENTGQFLEGTGSVVLDHIHKKAYTCLSPRTNPDVLQLFCERIAYESVVFRATDASGMPIYHTNVVMGIGTEFAMLCNDCLEPGNSVIEKLMDSSRQIIKINREQMAHFAGNFLELRTSGGGVLIVISRQAWASLNREQKQGLESFGEVLTPELGTIEALGGGSARCMLAEIFLPEMAISRL